MSIQKYTKQNWVEFLNQLLPDGEAFNAKYIDGSNLNKLQKARATEFKRFGDYISELIKEVDPSTTDDMLSRWEESFGIPDECIPLATTVEERRDNLVLKFSSLAFQSDNDLITLASDYGFTITLRLETGFPYTFPIILNNRERSLFLITGDFNTNPSKASIFQCLVRRLIPINRKVVFLNS
jgi:uncharacterized protein YmfQ (DUF2313 family)